MAASLKSNIAYNSIYQLLILALPLVTAPYLSRVIGAEGVGEYSYSCSIATYFTYFVKLGLDNYGNRSIASVRDDRRARSEAFWSIYAMQVGAFLFVAAVYIVYALFLSEDTVVSLIQGLFVLSSLFDVNWFFFGMERFRLTVVRNAIVKLLTTAAVFIFVRGPADVNIYITIMCGGFLLSQLCLLPFLRGCVDWVRPSLGDIIPHIKPNLMLFIPVVAVSVFTVLSKILLGAMAGTEAVGFYDNANKIVSVPVSLVTAVGTVMLPRASGLVATGKEDEASSYTERTLGGVMALTCLAAFGLPQIAHPFTRLFYGPGFEETAAVMCVLAITVPLLGFGNVVRSQYLIPHGRDRIYLGSAICGAIANVAVNILLIPRFGSIGAAFGSVASEIGVLVWQLVGVRREIPLARYLSIAASFVAAGVVMMVVLEAFVPHLGDDLADVITRVVAGCVVYLLAIAAISIAARWIRKKRV